MTFGVRPSISALRRSSFSSSCGVEAVKPCTAAFTRRFVRNDATIASAVSSSSCGDCPASVQRLKPTPLDPLRPLMAGGCAKRNSAA